ncbi:thymidine kinase [Streptococcus pneumoniae]|nr:thymidine kinase [Streptococcus pneumoniae]
MAQLYYRYGTMNSGKTIEILKVAYNYEEQGKGVVIMTSALDTRDGVGYVSSRIGMKRPALTIEETTDIFGYIRDLPEKPYCVLVDEAQFLKRHHVYDLARVVDELDIPVMAFGLKNDFRNELFEGSKYLLLLADKIDEIKTICQYCTWCCEHRMDCPFTMENRSRLVVMKPISRFAVNIILPLKSIRRMKKNEHL